MKLSHLDLAALRFVQEQWRVERGWWPGLGYFDWVMAKADSQ